MKIGGITWWRNNYGSILQAYALQQKLNSYDGIEYEIINQYGKKISSYDNLIDKLKNIGLRKTCQRLFWKFGNKKVRARNKNIQSFVDNYLHISEKSYNEETIYLANDIYDGFVCGSDQIWNPTMVSTKSMYWLIFAQENKLKFSYAPSIGVNSLNSEEISDIKKNLSCFNAISCREESGSKLIKNITDSDCVTVLDPTLLVDSNIWKPLYKDRIIKEPYIFVYLLRGTKAQRKIIEQFSSLKKMKIVTIPFLEADNIILYDFKFGDYKVWDCAPEDFISLIRDACYIFTDSFHSTIFSCINHKDFFIFPKRGKAQMNRLIDLQNMLGIKSRFINSYDDIERVQMQKINWDKMEALLSIKRSKSLDYLDNIFKNIDDNEITEN